MKKINALFLLLFAVTLGAYANITKTETEATNEKKTSNYFDTIRVKKDRAGLALFFSMMPKGGDLHHHYSGAIYAETYIDWAEKLGFVIDTESFLLQKGGKASKKCISIDALKKKTNLYRSVLENWSDLNFSDHFHLQDQPDQHFFNTFSFFGTVSGKNYRAGLAEIKNRAKVENVQYIETMLNSPNFKITYRTSLIDSLTVFKTQKDTVGLQKVFSEFVKSIQASASFKDSIKSYHDSLQAYHANLDDKDFSIRFQTYASRNSNPEVVFTNLYSCFYAVNKDTTNLLVGVNIVGPENRLVAMNDYWIHMQMFNYLKRNVEKVKTSMHAGELAIGMVKPEDLTYHINDALFTANADRIGHGVDIPYEKQALLILETMRTKHIPIEINLTSNEFILGIKDNDHPINLYYQSGVPIVICTDDAGVSRNNLTSEYIKLASRYDFNYQQIKSFVTNSIQFSFLQETQKEAIMESLEARFIEFEKAIAAFVK